MNIDAVGVGSSIHSATTSAATPATQEASRQAAQTSSTAAENGEDIQQMVDQLQNHIKMMNVSLEFTTYGEHGEKIAVIVSDKETGEVIREIPSKEIQNLYAKMSELTGMILNAQI